MKTKELELIKTVDELNERNKRIISKECNQSAQDIIDEV